MYKRRELYSREVVMREKVVSNRTSQIFVIETSGILPALRLSAEPQISQVTATRDPMTNWWTSLK